MSPSQIVLKLVLDTIGQPVKLDTFDDRFMIQKKIFLTQLTGLDLLYRFGWYLRGPYSRELTADVFSLKAQMELGDEDYRREQLAPEVAQLASKAPTIWANRPANITESDWLELLASLHYLKHIAWWPKGKTPTDFDGAFRGLVESKPRFADRKADAYVAWGQLANVGLVESRVMSAA